jgi:hypothetical protein
MNSCLIMERCLASIVGSSDYGVTGLEDKRISDLRRQMKVTYKNLDKHMSSVNISQSLCTPYTEWPPGPGHMDYVVPREQVLDESGHCLLHLVVKEDINEVLGCA